ncbi:hypothetical protein [Sphingomonas sp. VNH70]|uniref:hypothetical protein n=1 Tax=Sphingomonas silueang TaxID=3156617 RepID=UPI0032B5A250
MMANRVVALMLAAGGVQSATPVDVPADTPVIVELAVPVASNTVVNGDFFALRVASDVTVDGRVLLPAGTPGRRAWGRWSMPQRPGASAVPAN